MVVAGRQNAGPSEGRRHMAAMAVFRFSQKGIPMKKTWSLFVFAPLLALTLAAVGCDSAPEIAPEDSDTSEGEIQLTEEEEAGEAAIGNE
jgi:hypothetical protein